MSEVRTSAPAEWARLITDNFIGLAVADAREDFEGSFNAVDLGNGITLTHVYTAPALVLRTSRLVRSDACDDVLFLIHLSGDGASVRQEDELNQMPPGYGSIHLASAPYALSYASPSHELILQAPRSSLPSQELVTADRRRRGVDPKEAALRVYSAFARELLTVSDDLSSGFREEAGSTALDLLVSVLRRGDDNGHASMGTAALFHTMTMYVRENLGDPELSPEQIAGHHHISLRLMQQIFSDNGTSPAALIRNERLERACRILANPRSGTLSVALVAHRVGFGNVNTFIRAFRQRYGLTPGDWRQCARGRS